MSKKSFLYVLLLLCSIVTLGAEENYYMSNSIGQQLGLLDEADLQDEEILDGFIISVRKTDAALIRTLYAEDEIIWKETISDDGVHKRVYRIDPEGKVLLDSHYIQGFIVEDVLVLPEVSTKTTYSYDALGHIRQAVSVNDTTTEKTKYFINENGKLSGLMVYTMSDDKEALDHLVLIDDAAGTSAIGTHDTYRIIIEQGSKKSIYEYLEGSLVHEEKSFTNDTSQLEVISYDHMANIRKNSIYDAKTNLIIQELSGTDDSPDASRITYRYDDKGNIIHKTIVTEDSTTTYAYTYEGEDTSVTIRNNDILSKIITYKPTGRSEALYLKGKFYATIIYDDTDKIIKVINAQE